MSAHFSQQGSPPAPLVPAKAGTQSLGEQRLQFWIPAFAGMSG